MESKTKRNFQEFKETQEEISQSINKYNIYFNVLSQENINEFCPYKRKFKDFFLDSKNSNKPNLLSAYMTTFGIDPRLLESLAKCGTKLIVSNDNNSQFKYVPIQENIMGYKNFSIVYREKKNKGPYSGAFHPKLWILKFPEYLRIAIGSGNLTIEDWTVWSNHVWYHDFKLRSKEDNSGNDNGLKFKADLKSYINFTLSDSFTFENLTGIDFDLYYWNTQGLELISSVPGDSPYDISTAKQFGFLKVKEVLSQYKIAGRRKLFYQTSSLGNPSKKFLEDIANAFGISDINDIHIIYPTKNYISKKCKNGPNFSQPLFLTKKVYDLKEFPKNSLRKFDVEDPKLPCIGHLKFGITTNENEEIDDNTIFYFGSHNFTQSAWGTLQAKGKKYNVKNTELGILLGPEANSESSKKSLAENLPMKFPPNKYDSDDLPWTREDLEEFARKFQMNYL